LTLSDRTLVTFAYLALASLVVTLIYCYVDLGLTNGRVTVFMGVMLGALAVLRKIDQEIAAAAGWARGRSGIGGRRRGGRPPRPWSSYAPPAPPEPEVASAGADQPAQAPEPEPVGAGRG
jgi:hypothetical protein